LSSMLFMNWMRILVASIANSTAAKNQSFFVPAVKVQVSFCDPVSSVSIDRLQRKAITVIAEATRLVPELNFESRVVQDDKGVCETDRSCSAISETERFFTSVGVCSARRYSGVGAAAIEIIKIILEALDEYHCPFRCGRWLFGWLVAWLAAGLTRRMLGWHGAWSRTCAGCGRRARARQITRHGTRDGARE
jgi:hypothetical protein